MNNQQNIERDLYNKKLIILNRLYYMITHYIWNTNNFSDLDNLVNRFKDLSNDIEKKGEGIDNDMLLKNIRKKNI